MIGIIDYGVGNLFSLKSSLEKIGQEVKMIHSAQQMCDAERLILPGVGAFGDAREKLKADGLDMEIIRQTRLGKPLLGICLGMQMLFDESQEFGIHKGLGLISGSVTEMRPRLSSDYKVPQIGWNALHFCRKHFIFKNINEGECVYFVHSFSAVNCKSSLIAQVEYGIMVAAAVGKRNVLGTQFHPEKSGNVGLMILKNFCEAGSEDYENISGD